MKSCASKMKGKAKKGMKKMVHAVKEDIHEDKKLMKAIPKKK